MDPNTYSAQTPTGHGGPPDAPPVGLAELAAVVDKLAAHGLDGLSAAVRAERLLAWRQLLDRQEGLWLQELAAVDARGAAGADPDQPAPSTASWLRNRLRMGAGAARSAVRTARALFRGSLPGTAAALVAGEVSVARARAVADGTQEVPDHVKLEAEPVLLEAAGRLDPHQLRRLVGHLCQVVDPDGADRQADHRHERRGLWLAPTFAGWWPSMGCWTRSRPDRAGRPGTVGPPRRRRRRPRRRPAQRRCLDRVGPPQPRGWVAAQGRWGPPQLLVTVGLDSVLGRPGGVGGDLGWAGPLAPEGCRRLACDGAITRVVVTRQPDRQRDLGHRPGDEEAGATRDLVGEAGLTGRLRAAMTLLPPNLGGAPTQPLEVGRATRVVTPAQRAALAVRDRGCVLPGCERPLAWCDAHHLEHWVDGGPTDLGNLALLCRAHHRAVHEGGWRLIHGPDGRFSATPPHRRHRHAA